MNAAKRYKDIDTPFTCPISNRIFNSAKGLSVYVTKTLKMDHSEYYDKYVNHRDASCFFCGGKGKFISIGKGYRNLCEDEVCVIKSFNSHSIEGIMYRKMCGRKEAERFFDIENERQLKERMKTFEKLRGENPDFDKQRNPLCVEFYTKDGMTEKKANEIIRELRKKNAKKYSKTIKSDPEKYASKFPTKIEYWLKRGYSEKEAKDKISEIQNRFSLDICIEKYGDVKGLKIWEDRQNRWIETLDNKTEEEKIEINRKKLFNQSGYSKISQKLFWDIFENFNQNNIKFEELNGEIIRYDKKNKSHYRYDFVDFTTKSVIEFNGDFWHCNPNEYNENHQHSIMNLTAKEIWQKDRMKLDWIRNRGYDTLVVWESDYRKNPKQTLEKCIEFLNK